MRIRMLRARVLSDAGIERPLDLGQEYDLPQIVAESLIATGAAEESEDVFEESREAVAPEIRPMRPPETKRGGMRR